MCLDIPQNYEEIWRKFQEIQGKYRMLDDNPSGQRVNQRVSEGNSISISTCFPVLCIVMGPPINKNSFPVHQPGGLKRAEWDFFFHVIKNNFRKTKIPASRLAFFSVTRRTGNNFLPKVAWVQRGGSCRQDA